MYDGYWEARKQIGEDRLVEVTYEALADDAEGVLEHIYDRLDLRDFESVREPLLANLESRKNYQRNQHQLDGDLQEQINHHWRDYFEAFGYPMR